MRISLEYLIFHLLLANFLKNNIKCEINGNFLSYDEDDTNNFGESNSSDFMNNEKSYIMGLNSVSKNKRMVNNYSSLSINPLYGYKKEYYLKAFLDTSKNSNENAKLHEEEKNYAKSNGTCSSFMIINEHDNTTNKSKDINESRKFDKSWNPDIAEAEQSSRKMLKEEVNKELLNHKNTYNNSMLNITTEQYKQNMQKYLYGTISKKESKYIELKPHKFQSFNYIKDVESTKPNVKKNKEHKEKNISIHNAFIINKGGKNNELKNKGKKKELISSDNNTNNKDNIYFEKEMYIQIKYPVYNKKTETENVYHSGAHYVLNNQTDEKSVPNSSNTESIKQTDYKSDIAKESKNKTYSYLSDNDLENILKNECKPESNDNLRNNKTEVFKKSDSIEKEEDSIDLDLKDAIARDMDNKDSRNNDKNKPNVEDNGMIENDINDVELVKDKIHNSYIDFSIKYLGLGYDIIMGNPEGDPTLNIDPGFRGPVLKINIEDMSFNDNSSSYSSSGSDKRNDSGSSTNRDSNSSSGSDNNIRDVTKNRRIIKKNNKKKQRLSPWIIPEHSCNQSKNVEEIRNLEQYKLELSSDVKVSTPSYFPYSFSASAEYKNALKKLNVQNSVIFLMKIYCLRYHTGIPITKTWKFTDNFKNALKNLPSTFDGLKENSECTYEYYIKKLNTTECEKNVNKWMLFFKLHGTHIAHEIYLGGKITVKMNMDKNEYNKMKDKNVNVKTIFNFYFHQMGLSSSYNKKTQKILNKFRTSKSVSILGGNPGLNVEDSTFFEKWVDSINKNSMPIRTKLLPFSFFMDDPNMIKAYNDALTFYGLTYGIELFDKEKYNQTVLSIGEYLEKAEQKLYAGPPPGLLTCPIGRSLVMGFSLNLDFYKNKELNKTTGITICEQLKESCSGNGFENNYSDMRIWGLCSERPLDFIAQVVQQGESPKVTATCPGNMVILFGFALMKGKGSSSANKVDIYPCRTGQTSCLAVLQNSKFKQSMIYIACIDKSTKGLEDIQTFSKIRNMDQVNTNNYKKDGYLDFTCPKNSTLVFGFSLEFHTNFPKTRSNFTHCSKKSNSCKIKGIGMDTNLSLFRSDKHSLGIVAVCRSQTNKTYIHYA
ncbi:perforin-like protein 2 [Plasmodium brasilianum]|uniref:Perforin-like protein 2 n=2 Tax=Plasmodium (Plasmodium) TaxID=418103 RepID=A0A1A8WG22_PLAMA|nr:perforin-like protein 2, putative [Plasmodium malariae]KAI4834890.1 perforin-like protein 2 [Plasmodium brasilianum]SBS90744.1 perforin-like protein 2 [Plasmodium malariae]SCP03457.1 perforin-like protein 2, putative [Plasmodium malariae]